MKIFMLIVLAVGNFFTLVACGCKYTSAKEGHVRRGTTEIQNGTRMEDVMRQYEKAQIVRPPYPPSNAMREYKNANIPVREGVQKQYSWFWVRVEPDKYYVIDERGLVAGVIEKKIEISEKSGTQSARIVVVDEKLLNEYIALAKRKYIGMNIRQLFEIQGRFICASYYDVGCSGSIAPVNPTPSEKRELELISYLREVKVAEFLIAVGDGKWLTVSTDSNGTIVSGGVANRIPEDWWDYWDTGDTDE